MPDFNPYDLPGEPLNPYEAPRANLIPGEDYSRGNLVVEPFSPGAVWRMAWPLYKEKLGVVLGLVIGMYGVNYAYQFGGNFLGGLLLTGGPGGGGRGATSILFLQLFVSLTSIVLSIWLGAGMCLGLVKLAKGEDASVGDLFAAGRYFWSYLWGSIIVGACVGALAMLIVIPLVVFGGFAAQGNSNATTAVVVVLAVVGFVLVLVVAARLYFFQFALIDRGRGGMDAVKYSFEITRGHTVSVIGFMISASVIGASGLLACGVGMLFTLPLAMLMYACAYIILANQGNPGFAKGTSLREYPDL